MLTHAQAKEILQTLQVLPADKLTEVYDYLSFLRERYAKGKVIDVSDAWSDEDLRDLMKASLIYAERSGAVGEE